jgi:NCAIR mutase (PurE)-related protein
MTMYIRIGVRRCAQLNPRIHRFATVESVARFCAASDGQVAIPELSVLETFANLDHDRTSRTGFPEAVFAEGKTSDQVALILEAMAGKVNERARVDVDATNDNIRAILATRYASVSHDACVE